MMLFSRLSPGGLVVLALFGTAHGLSQPTALAEQIKDKYCGHWSHSADADSVSFFSYGTDGVGRLNVDMTAEVLTKHLSNCYQLCEEDVDGAGADDQRLATLHTTDLLVQMFRNYRYKLKPGVYLDESAHGLQKFLPHLHLERFDYHDSGFLLPGEEGEKRLRQLLQPVAAELWQQIQPASPQSQSSEEEVATGPALAGFLRNSELNNQKFNFAKQALRQIVTHVRTEFASAVCVGNSFSLEHQ